MRTSIPTVFLSSLTSRSGISSRRLPWTKCAGRMSNFNIMQFLLRPELKNPQRIAIEQGRAEERNLMVTEIIFPPVGVLRSRKVSTRSRFRPTGKHPSPKMERMMEFESRHERNAFCTLDCSPAVRSYSEQPCRVVYVDQGEKKAHYPDVLVEYANYKEFWEIKPDSEAVEPEVVHRTALMRDLKRWGYGYRVVRGSELAAQPRLRNCQQLLYFGASYRVSHAEQESVRILLGAGGHLSWGRASAGDYGPKGRQVLCSLVLLGFLKFDMESHWTNDTRFEGPEVTV